MNSKEEKAMEYANALYPNTETYNRIAYEGYIAGAIGKDAQTIAGIELALKKAAAKLNYFPHPNNDEDFNKGVKLCIEELAFIDPAAILSELKNDIKEG